ncbi:hypothetical protein ACA910_021115 [Epithemia clementina (nom. ined.)]
MDTIFSSADSFGSLKHEFVELFRSAGSSWSAEPWQEGTATVARRPIAPQCEENCEARSRSSSLETELNACDGREVSLDFSICPLAAASLADAGRFADCLADEPELVQDEGDIDSAPGTHEKLRPENPVVQAAEAEYAPSAEEDSEDACHAAAKAEEILSSGDWTQKNEETEHTPTRCKQKRNNRKRKAADDEFRLDNESTGGAQKKRQRKVYEPEKRLYVEYTSDDVLCQRGGLANSHAGNRKFLSAKEELQSEYFATPKLKRTLVSQKLVDDVHQWGGRFLRKDSFGWYEVHNHVARTKAGQALRETYTPEDRAEKRAKYNKKKMTKKRPKKKDQ